MTQGWLRVGGAGAGLAATLVACASLSGLTGGAPDAGAPDSGSTEGPPQVQEAAAPDAAPPKPAGAAVLVSAGVGSIDWCAVTVAGDVECWGDNEYGQLGDGTTTGSATPIRVKGLPGPAASVAMGGTSACALTVGGGVYCWGRGAEGQLGNGDLQAVVSAPVPVTGLGSGVVAISVGVGVACAVKAGGGVWCWGYAGRGMLGDGQMAQDALVPTPVKGLTTGATSVSVGETSVCAVRAAGVVCWGAYDGNGELGNETTNGSTTPVPVHGLASGVTAVSVGGTFACALTSAGAVQCWGDGTSGQLGNDQLALNPAPVQVQGLTSGVTAVAAGADSVCAVQGDGTVVCWGYGGDGELGNGMSGGGTGLSAEMGYASAVPVHAKDLSGSVISISTGFAPCAATTMGSVLCWGLTAETAYTPVPVTGLTHGAAASVASGGDFSTELFACAVANGNVSCWGGGGDGQLGNGATVNSTVPVSNASIGGAVTAVSAGPSGNFACALASGVVHCWGDNSSGQLGNGKTTSSDTAVTVQGLPTSVTSVSAGSSSACAIAQGGALYCWGDNTYGELGTGTTTNSRVAVPVKGLGTGVVDVSVGIFCACAVLSDGTVDCWGANGSGTLGNGTQNASLVPAPVTGLTGATSVAMGWYSACAVTQGTLQCWGDDTYGELGDGSMNLSLIPVPVSGVSGGATQVAVGAVSACAVVAGTVQCWGAAALGEGALSSTVPVPVSGLPAGATAIAVGVQLACAVAGGGVHCWGSNTAGQLGDGSPTDALTPTAVAGFP